MGLPSTASMIMRYPVHNATLMPDAAKYTEVAYLIGLCLMYERKSNPITHATTYLQRYLNARCCHHIYDLIELVTRVLYLLVPLVKGLCLVVKPNETVHLQATQRTYTPAYLTNSSKAQSRQQGSWEAIHEQDSGRIHARTGYKTHTHTHTYLVNESCQPPVVDHVCRYGLCLLRCHT